MSDNTEVWFENGGPEDGIFAGYGAGWYFKFRRREYGPYDTEEDAERVLGNMWETE